MALVSKMSLKKGKFPFLGEWLAIRMALGRILLPAQQSCRGGSLLSARCARCARIGPPPGQIRIVREILPM